MGEARRGKESEGKEIDRRETSGVNSFTSAKLYAP
jgi:hypothetical protein